MKTDFISRKERMYKFKSNKPPIIAAINDINCAQQNKCAGNAEAYKICIQSAIEHLNNEIKQWERH
jgi:hypothetical protein